MKNICATFTMFALLVSGLAMADDCKFAEGEIFDLKEDPRFAVSDENEEEIDGVLSSAI